MIFRGKPISELDERELRCSLQILIRGYLLDSPYLPNPKFEDVMMWEDRPVMELSREELEDAVECAVLAKQDGEDRERKRIEFELALVREKCRPRKWWQW